MGDTILAEVGGLSEVLSTYIRNILPFVLDHGVDKERIKLWLAVDDLEFRGFDVPGLLTRWLKQDQKLFANIRAWQLYQRDVPRNLFWERLHKFVPKSNPW